jgi:hypothetical protein
MPSQAEALEGQTTAGSRPARRNRNGRTGLASRASLRDGFSRRDLLHEERPEGRLAPAGSRLERGFGKIVRHFQAPTFGTVWARDGLRDKSNRPEGCNQEQQNIFNSQPSGRFAQRCHKMILREIVLRNQNYRRGRTVPLCPSLYDDLRRTSPPFPPRQKSRRGFPAKLRRGR